MNLYKKIIKIVNNKIKYGHFIININTQNIKL